MPNIWDLMNQIGPRVGIRVTPDSSINPIRHVQQPANWDRLYRAAVAAALLPPGKSSPLFVATYGGSDETYFATDGLATTWCGYQRQRLVNLLGLWGDFYHIRMNIVDAPFWSGTPPIVALVGGGRTQTPSGYGATAVYTALATTLWTFTTPYALDPVKGEIGAVYLDTATAMSWSLDGGSFTTVGVTNGNTTAQKKLVLNAASNGWNPNAVNGIHTLALRQSVAATCIPTGFYCCPGGSAQTFGVGYARLTYPGASVLDWYRLDQSPPDKTLMLAGNTSALAPVVPGFGFPMNAHLVQFAGDLAANDMILGNDPAITRRGLLAMMSASRRAVDDCTIAGLEVSVPDGVRSDLNAANCPANSATYPDYQEQFRDALDHIGGSLFSLHDRWGNLGVAKGFQTQVNGGFHMSPDGARDADQFLQQGGL